MLRQQLARGNRRQCHREASNPTTVGPRRSCLPCRAISTLIQPQPHSQGNGEGGWLLVKFVWLRLQSTIYSVSINYVLGT